MQTIEQGKEYVLKWENFRKRLIGFISNDLSCLGNLALLARADCVSERVIALERMVESIIVWVLEIKF